MKKQKYRGKKYRIEIFLTLSFIAYLSYVSYVGSHIQFFGSSNTYDYHSFLIDLRLMGYFMGYILSSVYLLSSYYKEKRKETISKKLRILLIILGISFLIIFLYFFAYNTTSLKCYNLNGNDKDSCLLELTHFSGNNYFCHKMESQRNEQHCHASTPKDISDCDKITIIDFKERCFYNLAKCNLISSESYKLYCFNIYNYHLKESDCDTIVNESLKSKCFSYVAIENGNIAVCNILNDSIKKECIDDAINGDRYHRGISELKPDETLCELVSNGYKKEHCFFIVSVLNKKPELCEKIGEETKLENSNINLKRFCLNRGRLLT